MTSPYDNKYLYLLKSSLPYTCSSAAYIARSNSPNRSYTIGQLLTFKQCNVSPFGNIWNLVSSPENRKGKKSYKREAQNKKEGSSHPQAEYNRMKSCCQPAGP